MILLWTEEEKTRLIKNWELLHTDNKELLKKFPNRTLNAIRGKASEMGLNKTLKSSLAFLLDRTNIESYYWMGFLLADGTFNHKGKIVIVDIHEKDKDHLIKLSKHLNTQIKTYKKDSCIIARVNCGDVKYFQALVSYWDINSNKTKNPPKTLPQMSDTEFSAWLIGFIDGDGSIDKSGCSGAITVDASWMSILDIIKDKYKLTNLKLRKQTTQFSKNYPARLRLSVSVLKELKTIAIKEKLPCMSRKWDRVILL